MGLFKKTEPKKHISKMAEMERSDRLEAGQLKLRVIIELLGKPKDIMEQTFDMMMAKLKGSPDVVLISDDRSPTKKQGKLFSIYTEAELWVRDFKTLASVLFEYLPSSVEVLEPQNYVLNANDLSNYLNDMQARLHQTDMVAKNLRAEVDVLKRQAGGMLNNLIVISLSQSEKTLKELGKNIGMDPKELDKYVKRFIDVGRIRKEGEILRLTRKK